MSGRFTLEGIRNLRQTGSLVKSSKSLARSLAKNYSDNNELILEFGAGEGVITKELLDTIGPETSLHSFEINEVFIDELSQIDDERLTVKNECVFDLAEHYGDNSVDMIVSCLPMANINKADKENLLSEVTRILKEGGKFVQYQYSLNDFRLMKRTFDAVNLSYCMFNLPPAFIYQCEV